MGEANPCLVFTLELLGGGMACDSRARSEVATNSREDLMRRSKPMRFDSNLS